jgi:hypothetical protein
MVLWRIFGPKEEEIKGEWRKLRSEELNDLYTSPNIIRVIKSRRMRWAGHVAATGRGDVYTGFCWENLKETGHLEDPGVEGRIILKRVFRKWAWTELIWLRIGIGSGVL